MANVNLPPYIPEDPELWFAIVEHYFNALNIVNPVTKLRYVCSAIGPHNPKIRKLIIDYSRTNTIYNSTYQSFQYDVLTIFKNSKTVETEAKMRQQLEPLEMGDQKPSEFLRHLRIKAGSEVPDSILREVLTNRLPNDLQGIFKTWNNQPLNKAAELADALFDLRAKNTVDQAAVAINDTTKQNANLMSYQITELSRSLNQQMIEMRREMKEIREAIHKSVAMQTESLKKAYDLD